MPMTPREKSQMSYNPDIPGNNIRRYPHRFAWRCTEEVFHRSENLKVRWAAVTTYEATIGVGDKVLLWTGKGESKDQWRPIQLDSIGDPVEGWATIHFHDIPWTDIYAGGAEALSFESVS